MPRPKENARPPAGEDSAALSYAPAGVRITHPDRVLYDDPPITKLDLANYYEAVAPWLMPHLEGRRLGLLRCPEGARGECFFQKHLSNHVPAGIEVASDEMIIVRSVAGLIALVQNGVIEFHTWGAADRDAVLPDRLTFDLDPDPNLPWRDVAHAANVTRELLVSLGLTPFLKTTGGKGLHIVVPLRGRLDWDAARQFSKAVAQTLEAQAPEVFVANMSKARRAGHVFVDYLRNSAGATAIAAFSARARAGAPVSLPVSWDVLTGSEDPRGDAYNVCNVTGILRGWKRGGPWDGYEQARTPLTAALRRRLTPA